MKKFLTFFLLTLLAFSLSIECGYAKRFGGGKSFGKQNTSSFSQQTRSPLQSATNAVSNKTNRWLGPIAGLITGGLIASLLMGHGLGTGILTWLIIAAAAFIIIGLVRSRMQPHHLNSTHNQPRRENVTSDQSSFFNSQQPASEAPRSQGSSFFAQPQPVADYPKDFQADNFLREAKAQFIRLQTAYDQKNLVDLRQFTTPEVFAEIQLQLHERGEQTNHTEVLQLEALLLEVNTEMNATVTSVRFSGLIKENPTDTPSDFIEIWHFRKENLSNVWQVAGLQQSS